MLFDVFVIKRCLKTLTGMIVAKMQNYTMRRWSYYNKVVICEPLSVPLTVRLGSPALVGTWSRRRRWSDCQGQPQCTRSSLDGLINQRLLIWWHCEGTCHRGRMEIDHGFASGAVVGRATTHSWGRPAPRCARSDGRPHSCVVARPTTAPDAKPWSIPTTYHSSL